MKLKVGILILCFVALLLWISTTNRIEYFGGSSVTPVPRSSAVGGAEGFQMRRATATDTYIETRPTVQAVVVYAPLEVLTRQPGLRALSTSAAGRLNRTYQVRKIEDTKGTIRWSQIQNSATGVYEDAPPLVTDTVSYTYPRYYQVPNAAGGMDASSETVVVRYGTKTPDAATPAYYKITMNYPFVKDVMERNMRTGAYGRELQRIRTPLKAGSIFYIGTEFPADTSKPPPELAQQSISTDKAGQPMPLGPADREIGTNTLPAKPEYVFPTDVAPVQKGPGATGVDFSQYVLKPTPRSTDRIRVRAIYTELVEPGVIKSLARATNNQATVKEIITDAGLSVWPNPPTAGGFLRDTLQTFIITFSAPVDIETTVKPYIQQYVPSVREFVAGAVSSTATGPFALTLANLFPTIEGLQSAGLQQGLDMRKNLQFHASQ